MAFYTHLPFNFYRLQGTTPSLTVPPVLQEGGSLDSWFVYRFVKELPTIFTVLSQI